MLSAPRSLCSLTIAALLLAAVPALAATKRVQVGPSGLLVFADEETGTSTTTITAGDTVEWVWASSGHSTTRTEAPKTWDSGVQQEPFTFSQTFPDPGTFDYFCIPHQFLGMTGTVVVKPAASATTTTLVSSSTTSTTVPLPPDVVQALASVGQELQMLRDQVTSSPAPEATKRLLTAALQPAQTRLTHAQAALLQGHRGSGKQALKAAARFVRRFAARLRSLSDHGRIPRSLGNTFAASAAAIQARLQALRLAI